jgi:hypothetical protein
VTLRSSRAVPGGARADGDQAAPPDPAEASKRSVLLNPDFRGLLASRTASTVASAVTWVVLPLYVYSVSHSALLAGIASAMNVIPYMVFGIVAGALVERSSPRRVMITVELCNAAIMLTVPALHAGHVLSIAVLCAVGFMSATAFVWFDVASSTLIPSVFGRAAVFHANGYLWSVATLVTALAAPTGFLLLDHWGIGWTFAALSAFYALSALFLALVTMAPAEAGDGTASAGAGPADSASRPGSTGHAMLEGLRFIVREPTIRLTTIIGVGSGISAGAIYGMIVVFANRALHLSVGDYRISWIIAASSVGALLASFTAPRMRRLPAVPAVAGVLGADTVLMVCYALSPDWQLALGAILLWNLAHTTLMIISISFRQTLTPTHLQSRVNAAGRMLAWGSVPLGSALCGAVTGWIGSREALLLLIIPIAASTVLAVAMVVRRPGGAVSSVVSEAAQSADSPERTAAL